MPPKSKFKFRTKPSYYYSKPTRNESMVRLATIFKQRQARGRALAAAKARKRRATILKEKRFLGKLGRHNLFDFRPPWQGTKRKRNPRYYKRK